MIQLPNFAIIGRMGSGKSEVFLDLRRYYEYEPLSFAEPLKIGCGTRDDRGLLQKVGHGMRELYADFWVNLLVHDMKRQSKFTRFAVQDCRYRNEVDALTAEGFKTIRVVADRNTRLARLQANGRLQDEAQLEHVGELQLDDYEADYTIYNNGTREELHADLVAILNRAAW